MPERHECPQCRNDTLERTAAGIWQCGSCGNKLAGGAYEPDTGAEQRLRRAVSESAEEPEELEEAREEVEV